MNCVWLSATRPDPEWKRISILLEVSGEKVADSWDSPEVQEIRRNGGTIFAIEREDFPAWTGKHNPSETDCAASVVTIDHHNPGDPGYGKPPSEYWEASSLGQVASELLMQGCRFEISKDWRYAAASDHCPAAAYKNLCPGIDRDVLLKWRMEEKSEFTRKPVAELEREVKTAEYWIQSAPFVNLLWSKNEPPVFVRDLRDKRVPQLPEASLRLGEPILCTGIPDRNGIKINLLGDSEGDAVRAFLSVYAKEIGLVNCYGDPARGFAGGYIPFTVD